ncbi:Cif family virulence factor [Niabella ginsengisoli]|uniref:DUF4440 domain-containing protein n=1 Tax=Niabella ginsengisoli TaxID=522298 RepID=A0ABS9SPA3_9BACT|nr:hypothetical protein [Niabella ginsengisoli]MCH5600170.1 hypothetical protein [Niabella ginsengisoli]
MKQLIIFSFLITISVIGFGQSKTEAAIHSILQKQTDAWNKGDINTFMQTYWKNDSLVFVGKNGVTYGWQNTLDNYKKIILTRPQWGNCDLILLKYNHFRQIFTM